MDEKVRPPVPWSPTHGVYGIWATSAIAMACMAAPSIIRWPSILSTLESRMTTQTNPVVHSWLFSTVFRCPTATASGNLRQQCLQWDLQDAHVPDIAWLPPSDPNFVSVYGLKQDNFDRLAKIEAWSYWDKVAAANAELGKASFHQQFGLERATDALLQQLHKKKQLKIANQTSTLGHRGIFIVFRGDSFLRLTFFELVRAVCRDERVLSKAQFTPRRYNRPHLFCCQAMGGRFEPCSMQYVPEDINQTGLKGHVRERVAKGDLCAYWRMTERFIGHHLEEWIRGPDGVVPDLFVINDGLHYGRGYLKLFETEFQDFMNSTVAALASPAAQSTRCVVVSSTFTTRRTNKRWDEQANAYERMREFVAKVEPMSVRSRTSYIDFHTLTGTDACGFATRFPANTWTGLQQMDDCGHHNVNSDPHLGGGAYMHLLDLLLNLLSHDTRRCDPAPYWSYVGRFNSTEEQKRKRRPFIKERGGI